MKKFISLMLVLLTGVMLFTACTSGTNTDVDKQHNTLGDDDGDGVIEDKDDGGKNDMTPDTNNAGNGTTGGNGGMTNNGGANGNNAGNGTTGGNGGMTNNGGAGRGFFGDGALNDGIDGMGDLAPVTP